VPETRHTLVTGATGFIASHLIPALVGAGWTVRGCGRRPRPGWFPDEVDYRSIDLSRREGLGALFNGVTHLFHLAGASSSTSTQDEMQRFNVEATANLLAAVPASGLKRMLHMSSTSVYGEEVQLPVPVAEDVEPRPSRGYGKAKWETEQVVWGEADRGLPVVVLRPVSVFGPGNVKLLASAVLDVAIEAWAGLDTLAVPATPIEQRLVHIDDLVAACLHLIGHDGAIGRAYNVVADQYPSSHDVATILADAFGMAVRLDDGGGLSHVERQAARAEMVAAGMTTDILLTEQRFRFLGKANRNNRLSIDALTATGFRFRHADLPPAVIDTIDWYRHHRWVINPRGLRPRDPPKGRIKN